MSAPSRLTNQQIQFELALMIQRWLEWTKFREGPVVEISSEDILGLAQGLTPFVQECQERR